MRIFYFQLYAGYYKHLAIQTCHDYSFSEERQHKQRMQKFISIKSTYSVINTQIAVSATVEGRCVSGKGVSSSFFFF